MGPGLEVNAALTILPEGKNTGYFKSQNCRKLFFRNFLLVGSAGFNMIIKLTELNPFLILI